jgi:hypothetical protein
MMLFWFYDCRMLIFGGSIYFGSYFSELPTFYGSSLLDGSAFLGSSRRGRYASFYA